jgi:hypothetical protein
MTGSGEPMLRLNGNEILRYGKQEAIEQIYKWLRLVKPG